MKIEELLTEHEDTILRIKTRLYFLTEFETQLSAITKDKPYRIKNDTVYRLIFDTWDMLVIDFASLAKGMLGSGGFFNQLKANLHEVKPLRRKEVTPPKGNISFGGDYPSQEEVDRISLEIDEHFIGMMVDGNKTALFDLFPNAKGRNPIKIRHEDVDALKTRFEGLIADVVDDRNRNRAHRYENIRSGFSNEKLNFEKLKERFEQVEDLLNKIRLVTCQSSFGYADMNSANTEETSKDLIFMILWGSNALIDMHSGLNERLLGNEDAHVSDRIYGWTLREKLVSESHDFHHRITEGDLKPNSGIDPAESKFCFNDVDLERAKEKARKKAK